MSSLRSRSSAVVSDTSGGGEDRRSLMSKWKEHYYHGRITMEPKKGNTYGSVFSCVFLASLVYTQCWILIPHHYPNSDDVIIARVTSLITWIMGFETLLNWILTARKKCCYVTEERLRKHAPQVLSTVEQASPSDRVTLPSGWRMCIQCQLPAPPRSHHCKVCNACILRRDHHCFFSGSCIGHHNQRHFIVWTFWVTVGGSFIFSYLLSYLDHSMRVLSYDGLYEYCLPIAFCRWCVGYYSTLHLYLLIQFYIQLFLIPCSAGFWVMEMFTVLRGETFHECLKQIPTYRTGPLTGLRQIFGPWWMVNFVWPLPTPQEGDGFNWVARKDHKSS